MSRVLLVLCALCVPVAAHAQVVITEIMYDLAEGSDSGREWIEIFNAGAEPVDLTSWKVFENGTNHKLSATSVGTNLAPGAYAVIADNPEKFKADWPAFGGVVFDSAFSLGNAGETIVVRDSLLADISSATFSSDMGGSGTGDSLQRAQAGALFEAGIPTPGSAMPAAGLVRTPQKAEAKKAVPKNDAVIEESKGSEIVGTAAEVRSETFVATVGAAPSVSFAWWIGPFAVAFVGVGGIVWSRHLKKDEWEIEEMNETG